MYDASDAIDKRNPKFPRLKNQHTPVCGMLYVSATLSQGV